MSAVGASTSKGSLAGAALINLVLVASGCDLHGCTMNAKLQASHELRTLGHLECQRHEDCERLLTCPATRVPLCEEPWGKDGKGYCDCAPTQMSVAYTDAGEVACADAGVPEYDPKRILPMKLDYNGSDGRCGRLDNNTGNVLDEDGHILLRVPVVLCKPAGSL